MNILYDGYIYSLQKSGGINRYISNLINHLPLDIYPTLTSLYRHSNHYPNHPNLHEVFFPGFRPCRISWGVGECYMNVRLRQKKFDIFHPTYYAVHGNISHKIPMVLTVHDMIHERYATQVDPTGRWGFLKKTAITRATLILCDSEYTRQDLLSYYPEVERKTFVIYLAAEIKKNHAERMFVIPKKPYYMYVGSRAKYKNFTGLLSAFANVISIYSDIELCVIGQPFTNEEKQLISRCHLEKNVSVYSEVSDEYLSTLYQGCLGLIYPSFYEGFGIPVLEAMECGALVIASNVSSIPEVVQNAGVLFDPNSRDELSEILLTFAKNPDERERYIAKGYIRAKDFSWQKTTDQTVEAYRSLVG